MCAKKPAVALPLSVPEIIARLDEAYGIPEWRPHHDPTSELILTILSQNTSDANSGRAFARLLQRFPTWEAVMEAPLPELTKAIQPGGLAPTKAPRIQAVLREIYTRTGGFDLAFLRDLPLEEAREWLRGLHGVGPKTVACVLMFALGRPAMPVDTHVFRVAMRLGLIPARVGKAAMTPEKAHALLGASVAPEDSYVFHIALIKHGRRVCTAQRPRCPECVLMEVCPSAVRSQAASSAVSLDAMAADVIEPSGLRPVQGPNGAKSRSQIPRIGVESGSA